MPVTKKESAILDVLGQKGGFQEFSSLLQIDHFLQIERSFLHQVKMIRLAESAVSGATGEGKKNTSNINIQIPMVLAD